jgi:PPP family 3-phenylpropionic acid transporter
MASTTHIRTLNPQIWGGLFYLTYFLSVGALLPFLNLYYQSIGTSAWGIGILLSLPQFMYLLAAPLWGALADMLHIHRRLLPMVMFATLLPILILAWINVENGSFVVLVILMTVFAFCLAPVIPLADHAVLVMLGEQRHEYGRLRLWGAVGFGGAAWVVGLAATGLGITIIFYFYLALMSLAALVAAQLPDPAMQPAEPFWVSALKLSGQPRWLIFLAGAFLAGVAYQMLNAFFAIFLTDLGGDEALFGVTMLVAGLSELPIFFLSGALLRRFGANRLFMVSLAVYALRAIFYIFIRDPRLGILGQALHGPSFSAMWVAGVSYAAEQAPPGLGASAQSAFVAVVFGLAGVTGALLSGAVYGSSGAQVMFALAASAALLGIALLAANRQGMDR